MAIGCQFSPTAPFSGFDAQGSRVVGRFESGELTPAASVQNSASAASASVPEVVVTIRERPSIEATVDSNGTFTLVGVPSGSFTLLFLVDGEVVGEIRIDHVRKNQGIRLTVTWTAGEIVLVEEERDRVAFSGECPRGPGFWCQNKSGQNPNLSRAEFDAFALAAAALLANVPALDTADEIAAAVCDTGNQFLRQLAALALNLASNTVQTGTTLTGEQPPYATVGDAFDAAAAHLAGEARLGGSAAEALKDVMDRINNAQNVSGCDQLPEDDETPVPDEDDPTSGRMTICHVPPGNYNARHTITIDASAWPAHKGHCAQGVCDSRGACGP
jgi:hypothetical protein